MLQLLGIVLLLVTSCSMSGPLREDRSAGNYYFPPPPAGWIKKAPQEGAEVFYEHQKSGALLSVSSLCDRYEESKLETLAMSALSSIENLQEKEKRTHLLDGREALEIYAIGKVDGVPIQIDYYTLRKNDCLFDFSLQGASLLTTELRTEFLNMLKKFRYGK